MSAQSLISQGFGGYAGWGNAEADADFKATGGSGKKTTPTTSSPGSSSGSSFSSTDPMQLAQQMVQMQQKANEPAVSSLQGQIPEVQAKYAQTRTQLQSQQPSIEQRYNNLLDQIKGNQTADVTAQTKATNSTLAARGLSTQDPGAQQDLAGAIQPINSQYTNMANQTGLAREDSLKALQDQIANLTPQETSDTRSIANAIAQLQSGAASTGIGQGLNLYSTQLGAQQADQARQDKLSQDSIANEIAKAQLANQTKQVNYETNKPYSSGSGTSGDISSLQSIFGQKQNTEARPTYNSGVGTYSKGGQWYLTNDGWAPVGK